MKRPILFALLACALGVALAAALLRPRGRIEALREDAPAASAPRTLAARARAESPVVDQAAVERRSPLERRIHFDVHDERGAPIEGASLRLSTPAGCVELAVTDEQGSTSVPAADVPARSVIAASAPSYATACVDTDSIDADEVELTLRAGGWIAGVVRTLGGELAGPDAVVVAIPMPVVYQLEPSELERIRCRDACSARTDARGRFRIEGLSVGETYRVEAYRSSASGWSRSRPTRLVATTSDAALELHELYGVLLRFTCADEAQMARFYREPDLETLNVRGMSLEVGFEQQLVPRLASWTAALREGRCVPIVCSRTQESDPALPTVTCGATIPGFKSFYERVELAPVHDGRLTERRIELVSDARGAGSLRIELSGPYAGLAARLGLEAKLALYPTADDRVLTYKLRWSDGECGARLDDVPSGTYRWTAFMSQGLRPAPPAGEDEPRLTGPFELADGGDARLELELPPMGFLEIDCRRGGAPCVTTLLLSDGLLGRGEGDASARPSFGSFRGEVRKASWAQTIITRGTPELVGPFAPGRYDLAPAESRVISDPAIAIELAAGEAKRVVIEAP